MFNSPLVSIIIPLYNAQDFVLESIASALNQTYQNIELIVVDDYSTDNSYDLVSSLNSPKITLVRNNKKGGCAARNYGFELSKGDYIQYLDADDILSPNKIKEQLTLIVNNPNTIASCGWTRFTSSYENLEVKPQYINQSYREAYQWLIDSWTRNEMGQTSIWLTPRVIIEKAGNWNEQLSINQDGEFFCRVILNASAIIYEHTSTVYYRVNLNSITQTKKSVEKTLDQLASYKLCEKHILEINQCPEVKFAIGNKYLKFIYHNDRYYPKVASIAWNYFYHLNIGKEWIIGGKKFKVLAKMVGFKFAIKMIRLLTLFNRL
jgi:glycosyltransferase involved in cell wall biosynthesis